MEANGIATVGKITASEISNDDGTKAVRITIGDSVKDFPNTIEACDYIVKSEITDSKRKLVSRVIIEGAVIGAAIAAISRTNIASGISVGTLIALFSAKVLGRR